MEKKFAAGRPRIPKGWIAHARAPPIWCATSDKQGWCNCKVFVFLVGRETGKPWFYTTVVYRWVYLLVFLNFSSKVRVVREDIAQSLSSLTLVVLRDYRLIAVFSHSSPFSFLIMMLFSLFFLMSSLTSQIEKGNAKDIWGVVIESPSLLGFLVIFSKLSWKTGSKLPYSPTLNLFHPPCPLPNYVSSCAEQVWLYCWENCWCCLSPVQTEPVSSVFSGLFFFFPFLVSSKHVTVVFLRFLPIFFLLCTRWNFAKFHTFLSVFLCPH